MNDFPIVNFLFSLDLKIFLSTISNVSDRFVRLGFERFSVDEDSNEPTKNVESSTFSFLAVLKSESFLCWSGFRGREDLWTFLSIEKRSG